VIQHGASSAPSDVCRTVVGKHFVGHIDLGHLVLCLDEVVALVFVRVPLLRELAVG